MKRHFFCLLSLLISSSAFCQGEYLKPGQSGQIFSFGYSKDEGARSYFGTAGFSYRTIFEGGVDIGRTTSPKPEFGSRIQTTGITPYIAFHDKNEEYVSFIMGINRQWATHSSQDLDDEDLKLSSKSYGVFLKLYRGFSISTKTSVIPYVAFGYDMIKSTLEDDNGNKDSDDDNVRSIGIGLPLIYTNGDGNKVVALPAMVYAKKNVTFSVSIGFVFAGTRI
ncbi:hypothetical protein F9K33_01915 [bacterium]|nr:MAG: hypothetical protein F9K33_01915 [bacterium]